MKTPLISFCCALLLVSWSAHAQMFKSAWPDTDFDLKTIEFSEIMSGGPPKDGIPPIDRPQFDSVADATEWIGPKEPVIVVSIDGASRAYPLQILTWHEIVNDALGGVPITVTFCPLCNASIVFDRRVTVALDAGSHPTEQVLDFGTTGLLRMSDLIMYDRQTESWWQQFTGSGIVGQLTGVTLNRVHSEILSFETFAVLFPEGEVLNRETGIDRAYGQNPYPGYDNINSSPFLFRGTTDDRLPPMRRVLGIKAGDAHRIYPLDVFDSNPVIEDKVGSVPIVAVATGKLNSALDEASISGSRLVNQVSAWQRRYTEDGDILSFVSEGGRLIDTDTRSEWNAVGAAVAGPLKGRQLLPLDSGIHFAFAWLAFNPETSIYGE